jgi:peptidoglycan hydrolase FlgJ
MSVSPLQRHVSAADLPIESLAGNSNVSESAKVGEVSRQFEAVLLRQVLASAQKTTISGDKKKDTSANAIYQDILTNQMADTISRSNALGLGQSLSKQLHHDLRLGKIPGQAPAQTVSVSPAISATHP